jgi:hypothetical protein
MPAWPPPTTSVATFSTDIFVSCIRLLIILPKHCHLTKYSFREVASD